MLAKIGLFKWYIFAGGYKCEGAKKKKTRVLSPDITNDLVVEERYPLEDEPGLHRRFAALTLTEDAIISFANQWGPLTSPHDFCEDNDLDDLPDFGWKYEPTETWFEKIRRMKALVGLWDVINGDSERKLADVIDFDNRKSDFFWDVRIRFKDAPELFWNESFEERNWPGFFSLIGRGAEQVVARRCLFDQINNSLWGSVSPGLGDGENSQAAKLLFTPHNLEAAMWLLFVQEILGNKTFKQCVVCKNHFEVPNEKGARRGRSDRRYCTPKCRAAAFRERNEGGVGEGASVKSGKIQKGKR